MSKISALIWLLILLASSLVIVFITKPEATKQFLGNEGDLFKLTYQFLLITVIGGGVALVFKQLDRWREMRQSLREMHVELLQAFNQAKTVRRQLRAQLGTVAAVNPDTEISAELYDDQMDSLSDAQLIFEIHAKRAKDNSLWFWGNPKLSAPLHKVEAYLNDIIKEYQKERTKFSGSSPRRRIGDLPKLVEFIGPYSQAAAFKDNFKYPMRDALEALGKAVLR
jgi:hypothetical protein